MTISVFNSDHWFQRRCLRETGHVPWRIKFVLVIFHNFSKVIHKFRPPVSVGKISKVFNTVISHDPLAAISLIDRVRLAFLVEDYPGNIPVKCGQNTPSGIGGVIIKTKLFMTTTTEITRSQYSECSSHCAQVS